MNSKIKSRRTRRAHADRKKVYPYQIAFNVIPQVDSFGANGYTGEETKMMQESRKIMGLPNLKVSATTRARAGGAGAFDFGECRVRAAGECGSGEGGDRRV